MIISRLSCLILLLVVVHSFGQQGSPAASQEEQRAENDLMNTSGLDTSYRSGLNFVNRLLDRYNPYSSSIEVNPYAGTISFKDKFSVLTAEFDQVEFLRKGENITFSCKVEGDKCLRQVDTESGEFETYMPSYSFGIKQSGKAIPETDQAIDQLNEMLVSLVKTKQMGKAESSVELKQNLEVINSSFRLYNDYQTVFGLDGRDLIWTSEVGENRVDVQQLTFYVDYANKWIVFKCIESDCIEDGGPGRDQYSMSLKTSSGNIAPDIELVLAALNNLRKELLQKS